ncbi:neural cell adhesion molecule 1-like isoform X2 [Hydractinia symbiolongicarpus]|uniref:neural cell adhesion molecule 1-like isoform X2 n=1 Tax=Hydractinia symbiolongicarpus TaxID=13093 RepID=UPI00254A7724|nr:neural cell adhesion molecule 1-like isoform X2 [Hydractinia symbiolongicarpus]
MHMAQRFVLCFLASLLCGAYAAKWTSRFKYYSPTYGKNLEMRCESTGEFSGFYFKKDGSKIETTESITVSSSGTVHTLTFKSIKEEDFGKYICRDSAGDDEAELEIIATIPSIAQFQKLTIGREGTVNAEVFMMPRTKINWYKYNDVAATLIASLDKEGNMVATVLGSERYKIDVRGSLIIKKVTAEDGGLYTVGAPTEAHGEPRQNTSVGVGNVPTIKDSPKETYTSTEYQDLFIPCTWNDASGLSKWTFSGKDGDKELTDEVQVSGLNLTSVTRDNEGNYTCSITNDFGEGSVTVVITQVITPAAISSVFNDTSQVIDTPVNISCEATGRPVPTVSITKASSAKAASGKGRAVLTINRVAVSDKGKYMCTADNGATTAKGASMAVTKSMEMDVLTRPAIDKDATTATLKSAVGLKFVIECSATSNPDPKVTFSKNGTVMDTNSTKKDGIVTAVYEVKSAVKSDFGEYLCIATNPHGNASKRIKIVEVFKPIAVTGFDAVSLNAHSIEIKWVAPSNIKNPGILLYKLDYCAMVNTSGVITKECYSNNYESRDSAYELKGLKPNTLYLITVTATNQGVVGEATNYTIRTPAAPTVAPSPVEKKDGGLGNAAVAGIIICIILVILVVVDLFCCFFNNCGFSHCCFETFCATKGKKYAPADRDEEEMEEMKPKTQETV